MKPAIIPAIVTASIALSLLFLFSPGTVRSEVQQPGPDAQHPQVEGIENVRPYELTITTWDQQGWAKTWDGQVDGYVPEVLSKSVAISQRGTIFVAGTFLGAIDFDPSPDTNAIVGSSQAYDCFLSKFNMNGDFEWVLTFGGQEGTTYRVNARSVDADNFGNVYLTGDFMGPVDFDPDPDNEVILTATGGESPDPFLCKFNSAGELLWAKDKSTSTSEEYGWDVQVDYSNNVFWTGYYVIETQQPGSDNVTRNDYTFLTKFDSNGNQLWNRKWAGSGGNDDQQSFVDVDGSGAAYVSGYYFNIADLSGGVDPDNYTFGSYPNSNCYVVKYTADGGFVWAAPWGNDQQLTCNGVAVEKDGSVVYAAGTIVNGVDPVDFSGEDGLPGAVVEPEGYSAGYIVTFRKDTGAFQNLELIDGPGGSSCSGLALDKYSNPYTMGTFTETIDCGGEILTAVDNASIYIARFSNLGSDLWTNVLTATVGLTDYPEADITATGIAIDPAFGAYVTGYFKGTVDFAPTGVDNHTSATRWGASFLVSYPESGDWGRLRMMDRPEVIMRQPQ